jgi:hypothetical protein
MELTIDGTLRQYCLEVRSPQDITQLSQSVPTLKYWGDLPIVIDSSPQ